MIRVEALGGLRILVGDQESAALAKQRLKSGLLVYLAVERSVMREALIATFWPDKEPDRARHALSQNLYELRKMLGEEWLQVAGDRLAVADTVRCDALEFIDAAEGGALHEALQLYRGSFLEGCYLAESREFEEWIDRRQDRTHKLLRRVLREASQLEERPEYIELAIEVARKAVERDPTDDDAQHAHLQLLVRAGQRSEALKEYEKYEAVLKEEDLEPLEHTRQLIAVARETQEQVEPQRVFPLPSSPFPQGQQIPGLAGEPDVAPAARRLTPRRGVLAGSVLVAIAVSTAWLIGKSGNDSGTLVKGSEPSIAVLPFDDIDINADGQLKPLANAFTEGLIDGFRSVRGFHVLPKTAVRQYADRTIPYKRLAADLGANFLVEGSVEASGDEVRVRAKLIDVASGGLIEVPELRRSRSVSLDRRDEFVEEVVVEFRKAIGRELETRRRRRETRSSDAWELYEKARRIYEDFPPLLLAHGIDAAERTLHEPDSLLALAEAEDRSWNAPIVLRGRLASMGAQVAMSRGGLETAAGIRAALDRAIEHANRAIEKNGSDAEALELRGVMTYRIWWTATVRDSNEFRTILAAAERDLRKATGIDPTRVDAYATLSRLYLSQARFAEAREASGDAYTRDRYYAGAQESLFQLALASFELGEEADAVRWCSEGAQRYPRSHQFVQCALMLLAWGNGNRTRAHVDSAVAILSRVPKLHAAPRSQDPTTIFQLIAASVLARAGQRSEALAMISRTPRTNDDMSMLWIEAAARARLGQADMALTLLRRFVALAPIGRVQVLSSRALDPLSNDPGFMALQKQAGIKVP